MKTKPKYEVLMNLKSGAKIYGECSDGSSYIIFDHLDGMYSYCVTEKGAVVHLSVFQPLVVRNKDEYEIK